MVGKFIAKVFRRAHSRRSPSSPKPIIRRIMIEPLESRRLLAVTASLSGYAYLDTLDSGVMAADEAGFAGLTVNLQSVDSQGNLSNVSGVGPVQTNSDGSYSFTGLAAGTYQIEIQPPSTLAVGTLSPGSAGGTAGTNEIQVALAAGQTPRTTILRSSAHRATRFRCGCSCPPPSLTQFLTSLHAPPSVDPAASGSTTYTTGGSTVTVVPIATIAAPDSPTLTSMTVAMRTCRTAAASSCRPSRRARH